MASHTRFSGALAAIFLLSLPACGDSTSTTTATTVATTESSGPNTGTETATDTTTTTTTTATTEAVTTGPTTTTATPETSTGPATTETTAASATTAETTGETTGAVTTETGGETTTTTGETTGDPRGATCEQDSDCQIYTDCCTCDVLADGEQPPTCDILECFVDVCSTYDLTPQQAVCRFGRCTFAKATCNPSAVTCKSQPPDCGPGTLPSVAGDCWTGKCTPVEACDWAPDCAACTTDPDPLVCVFKAQKGAYHVCEPKPAACGEAPEIDCACGQEICDASPPHTECHDVPQGIACECPFC